MLLFPRQFRMYEMERPQHMGGFFDDDYDSFFLGGQSRNTQQRVPVPVHHQHSGQQQHQAQYQMPIPSPTGNYFSNQRTSEPVRRKESEQKVRKPIEIPVRHVPIPREDEVPLQFHDECEKRNKEEQVIGEFNQANDSPQLPSTDKERPAMRKQTSLVVPDDHTTPVPMTFERLQVEDTDGKQRKSTANKKKFPTARKRSSLVVSDDHATPIPMPYPELDCEQSIKEEGEHDEYSGFFMDTTSSPDDQEMPTKALEKSAGIDPKESRPAKTPRKIVIASEIGISERPQKSGGKKYITKGKGMPTVPFQNDHNPQTNQGATSASLPQPNPTGIYSKLSQQEPSSDTSEQHAQPKPPPPTPKPQWIDPRITEAVKLIEAVSTQARDLGTQVDTLNVVSKDRTYLGIEEQLTKLLLKLDSIDSLGDDGVRSKRKACIKQVQQTLDALELKLLSS